MAAALPGDPVLFVSTEELIACALPNWYDQFKDLTFKSVFIPLEKDFVDYLLSDGIVLPKECSLPSPLSKPDCVDRERSEEVNGDDESDSPSFPELVQKISNGIQALQGEVFPKLNWSSPQDASWITPGNTLKCTTPGEVILLLKSSTFISHDLSVLDPHNNQRPTTTAVNDGEKNGDHVSSNCAVYDPELSEPKKQLELEHILCLRQWRNMELSGEFRCFVCNHRIIAISQRDCTNYYGHLAPDRDVIIHDITQFQSLNIAHKFPVPNYVMDVFRPHEGTILLVDFNPFSKMTDGLLFSWEEINLLSDDDDGSKKGLQFRIVSDPSGIQPSSLHFSRLPKDFLDLSTGSDIHKLIDILSKPGLQQQ